MTTAAPRPFRSHWARGATALTPAVVLAVAGCATAPEAEQARSPSGPGVHSTAGNAAFPSESGTASEAAVPSSVSPTRTSTVAEHPSTTTGTVSRFGTRSTQNFACGSTWIAPEPGDAALTADLPVTISAKSQPTLRYTLRNAGTAAINGPDSWWFVLLKDNRIVSITSHATADGTLRPLVLPTGQSLTRIIKLTPPATCDANNAQPLPAGMYDSVLMDTWQSGQVVSDMAPVTVTD